MVLEIRSGQGERGIIGLRTTDRTLSRCVADDWCIRELREGEGEREREREREGGGGESYRQTETHKEIGRE